ncbi:MAG TPA: hypothetical protein VL995_21225 [Cellvibrio sp.]|nr:hypothetical protein [Cellvibrio sp.]
MKKIKLMLGSLVVMVISCFATATMPGDETLDALNYGYRLCSPMPYKGRDPAFGCPKIEKITYRVSIYGYNDLQESIKNHMKESIENYSKISIHNHIDLIQQKSHVNLSNPVMNGVAYGNIPDQYGIDINFSVRLAEGKGKFISYVTGLIVSGYSYDVLTDISSPMNKEELYSYLENVVDRFVHNQLAPSIFPDARSKIIVPDFTN